MSHLVIGNPDAGLKLGLALAYDSDPAKRAIFGYVFSRVLKKGTKFETKDSGTDAIRRSRLCELVKGPNVRDIDISCHFVLTVARAAGPSPCHL